MDYIGDDIDRQIILALRTDARMSYAKLAERVNLTAPAVKHRMQKLQDNGTITGYQAILNSRNLGYEVVCYVMMAVQHDREQNFRQHVESLPEVLECYLLTGESSFLLKVNSDSIDTLNIFLNELIRYGHATTHIVLKQIFTRQSAPNDII